MPDISNKNGIDMGDIASINEQDVPSGGGGTATTTPTISVDSGLFGVVEVTVTNHSSYTNPNYSASVSIGGTEIVADSTVNHGLDTGDDSVSDLLTLQDTNSSTSTRTVSVKAQEFGDYIQSSAVTATYNLTHLSSRYIRIRGVNANGSDSANRLAIYDMRFYENFGQSGTVGTDAHPAHLTADTSSGDLYHVTAGHVYSSSYPIYQAFDSSTSQFSMWWALGTSAANNWIQVYFDPTANSGQFATPPTIKSMSISLNNQSTADYIAVQTSSDGTNFTTETILPIPNNDMTASFTFG